MQIEPKTELTLEEMRFISKKSKNLYSVMTLTALQDNNVFFFEPDFGFVRIEYPQDERYVWVHGLFWGAGVFRNFRVFSEMASFVKTHFQVGKILCQIPLDCASIHRLLLRIGFHVDFNYQRFADEGTLVYSKYIGG